MKRLSTYITEKQIKIGNMLSFDDSKFEEYFRTEKGRNKIAELCIPYVHAIANTYKGYDGFDLFSAGLFGLTEALNHYSPEKNDDFLKYAGKCIDGRIKDYLHDATRTVRIPASQKSNKLYDRQRNISLTELIDRDASHDDDYDYTTHVDLSVDDALDNVDINDIEYLVDVIKKKLHKNFKEKEIKIFLDYYGLNERGEKVKNKDLAKQYDCVESNITYITNKVKKYLRDDLRSELLQLRDFLYK